MVHGVHPVLNWRRREDSEPGLGFGEEVGIVTRILGNGGGEPWTGHLGRWNLGPTRGNGMRVSTCPRPSAPGGLYLIAQECRWSCLSG